MGRRCLLLVGLWSVFFLTQNLWVLAWLGLLPQDVSREVMRVTSTFGNEKVIFSDCKIDGLHA